MNQWVPETANWRIAGQTGNPAPSAEFFTSPTLTNYSSSLVSSLTGRKLATYNISEGSKTFTADISNLPKGIYLLRFNTGDGKSGGTKLVVCGD